MQDFDDDFVFDLSVGRKKQLNENILKVFVNEKRYMNYIKKYGLDDPMTYKQKARLDIAIKKFEREAGINWPIRN